MKTGYILYNVNWGWCVNPHFPSQWDDTRKGAYVFTDKSVAERTAARWAPGMVEVQQVNLKDDVK